MDVGHTVKSAGERLGQFQREGAMKPDDIVSSAQHVRRSVEHVYADDDEGEALLDFGPVNGQLPRSVAAVGTLSRASMRFLV